MKTKQLVLTVVLLVSTLFSFSQDLTIFEENGKYGFKDQTGKVVIKAKYNFVTEFTIGFSVANSNGSILFINKKGIEFTDIGDCYTSIEQLGGEDALALKLYTEEEAVTEEALEDVLGEEVVTEEALEEEALEEVVMQEVVVEYLLESGKVLYLYETDFRRGLARVSFNEKHGYINKEGKEVVPLKYDELSYFSEGFCAVSLNGKCGFVNKEGKEVIALKYDWTGSFVGGLAKVFVGTVCCGDDPLEGKYGYINKEGVEVIALKYDKIHGFNEGFAPVEINDKWGFINKEGKEITALKYDWAYSFFDGFAMVFIGQVVNEYVEPEFKGIWGFINTEGKEVVACKYDELSYFENGKAEVVLNGETFYINTKGERVEE